MYLKDSNEGVGANVFSISGDFHLNSRPTNRARMYGHSASPLFLRIHLVETNSLPLASASYWERVWELNLLDLYKS